MNERDLPDDLDRSVYDATDGRGEFIYPQRCSCRHGVRRPLTDDGELARDDERARRERLRAWRNPEHFVPSVKAAADARADRANAGGRWVEGTVLALLLVTSGLSMGLILWAILRALGVG